jgi:hypothetical protein
MMIRRGAALAVLVAGLASAASAAEPDASTLDANLFVYRDSAQPAGCAAELLLDGKPFARLAQHRYTSLRVGPGIHQLQFRWPADCGHGDVTNQLKVEERRLYYYALAGDMQVTRFPGAMNLHETTTLMPVDPDEGVQAVGACCRFVPSYGRF